MSWLLRHNWLWSLLAFLIGAVITWILLVRREHSAPRPVDEPMEDREEVLVGATAAPVVRAEPRPVVRPEPQPVAHHEPTPVVHAEPAPVREKPNPAFSELMEGEPTLFDDVDRAVDHDTHATEPQVRVDAPPGRYGDGSADAVPHQGPPDGFTIKGNAQSMLFHTPDSPYYGRTKPQVWFRTESDAERAGFTKYARRPRKSANPHD